MPASAVRIVWWVAVAGLALVGGALVASGVAAGAWLLVPPVALVGLVVAARSGSRRILAAARRCDLASLEGLAREGPLLSRLHATLAFLHHGGFDHDEVRPLCTCGTCERDALEVELDDVRQTLRLAWAGHTQRALQRVQGARARVPRVPNGLGGFVQEARAITSAVCVLLAAAEEGGARSLPFGDLARTLERTAYRWPVQLALAAEAAGRGKPMVARKYLEGMPSWPAGSRLEQARARLLARLGR